MHGRNERTEFLTLDFRIDSGETVSEHAASSTIDPDTIENPRMALCAIVTPATLTSTSVTFQVSVDGTTYNPVYDDEGNVYTVPVGTSRFIVLKPRLTWGFQWIKIVCGSAEGGNRVIKGLFRVA